MEKSLRQTNLPYPQFALPEATVPESLLLMTIRLWRKSWVVESKELLPDWRGGLCALGLAHIAEDIVSPLLGSIFYTAESPGAVGLHACSLGREELLVINAIGAIQHRRMAEVRSWVSGLVFPATARVVIPLLTRLAAALEFKGMVLPDRTTGLVYDSIPDSSLH